MHGELGWVGGGGFDAAGVENWGGRGGLDMSPRNDQCLEHHESGLETCHMAPWAGWRYAERREEGPTELVMRGQERHGIRGRTEVWPVREEAEGEVEVERQQAIGHLWLKLHGMGSYGLGCHQSRSTSPM